MERIHQSDKDAPDARMVNTAHKKRPHMMCRRLENSVRVWTKFYAYVMDFTRALSRDTFREAVFL